MSGDIIGHYLESSEYARQKINIIQFPNFNNSSDLDISHSISYLLSPSKDHH